MTRLEIVEPRPEWPSEFRRVAGQLREAFGSLALRIDHIGSTSVPGLPAKDAIDIQIAVASLEPCEPILHALDRAGLKVVGSISGDHRPEGDDGADEERAKIFAKRPERAGSDGQRGEPSSTSTFAGAALRTSDIRSCFATTSAPIRLPARRTP